MKKIVAIFLFLFSSNSLYAAGPYDGIWIISENPFAGYFVVTENNGQMIVVGLNLPSEDEPTYSWDAASGIRNNNTVRLETIVSSSVNVTIDVVMTSDAIFTMTQVSCAPISADWECKLPNGTQFHGTKIF